MVYSCGNIARDSHSPFDRFARLEAFKVLQRVNSFPCHTSAKFTRNSFRCHTYKFALPQVLSLPHIQKTRGCPLWECGGLAAAFTTATLAPNQPSRRGAATSRLFFSLHNVISHRSF